MFKPFIYCIGLIMLLTGCASNNSQIDFNPNIDFQRYQSFTFTRQQTNKPLMANRIEQAISNQLGNKGLSQQAAGDLQVSYSLESMSSLQDNGTRGAIGIGGGGSNVGVGVSISLPIGKQQPEIFERLTIDFKDPNSGELVWRGMNSFKQSRNSPEKNTERVTKTVKKILDNYPPK